MLIYCNGQTTEIEVDFYEIARVLSFLAASGGLTGQVLLMGNEEPIEGTDSQIISGGFNPN